MQWYLQKHYTCMYGYSEYFKRKKMIMTVNLQSAPNMHGKAMIIVHTGLPSLPTHKQIRERGGERELAVKQIREQDPNIQKVQKNAMY